MINPLMFQILVIMIFFLITLKSIGKINDILNYIVSTIVSFLKKDK